MSPIIASVLDLARTHFRAMETGDAALAAAAIHPDHVNHEAPDHPPASRQPGLPGFLATSAWLRLAFSDLHFDLHDLVTQDDRCIAHVTFSGRQTGPFVVFPPGGRPIAFPPTGAAFAVRQCHLFTLRDGRHLDHAAVRDDLGMMTQLGHLPPSPKVAARMLRWQLTGGARRAVRTAITVAALAADPAAGA
jgi:predicted ester cyclase